MNRRTTAVRDQHDGTPPESGSGGDPVLSLRDVTVRFDGQTGAVIGVNNLSLTVEPGEMIAIVGESGSGKTTLTNAMLGLPKTAAVKGSIRIGTSEVVDASKKSLRSLRRYDVATILQDPVGSLNPVRTIGSQLRESAAAAGISARPERETAIAKVLGDVGLDAGAVCSRLPHELSGGMNQRVTIAMALLKRPKVLIADEATSALDVRTQASVAALLRHVAADYGAAVLLVTHDIGLAVQACDRVAVMYAGRLVEHSRADSLMRDARHPYTRALLAATPRFGDSDRRAVPIPGQLEVGSPDDPGCPFRNRCDVRQDACAEAFPDVHHDAHGSVWCWNEKDHD